MNFGAGPSSKIWGSSSSSSDGETLDFYFQDWEQELEEMKEEEEILKQLHARLQANERPKRRGSIPGHVMINRGREEGNSRLWNDYFSETPTYGESIFRRRFRCRRNLFIRIVNRVADHDNFFMQKRDATGKLGLSTLQKVTAAHRMLAYGTSADATDEYIRIGESTTIECLKRFCRAVIEVFGEEYLRHPTTSDITRLLKKGEERGFPGMLGSLDCMHWKWKNCPTAWAGQYSGRQGKPTIILEAVASYDLWIWHAYFGLPGSNNDINVLQSSNLFDKLAQGTAPPANYTILGKDYDTGYYLADGIYPKWSTLVQTISQPQGPKKQYFAAMQEGYRKDVERAFGVLQIRFAIIKGSAWFWDKRVLHDIMTACVILHNMIVEDEREEELDNVDSTQPSNADEMDDNDDERLRRFLARHRKIQDREAHFELRNALIEHLWQRHGNGMM
ncbi:putative nuclease HARBI1 [Asparagus officinalis]|uniref:putative nuclease HARBI1 n=1 Tax=Asparagus officinalis TaxID=4686 RepID=UPI00098E2551|nr:putative nuclease HARBI1 [Asparagus officinalis]